MTTVHRLLDEAFAGVELTDEVLDLKDEIRANLEARAAELQAAGSSPDDAARRAFDELGDVRALVADATGSSDSASAAADTTAGARQSATQRHAQAAARHKVRPKAGFVVGVVLASLVGAGALVVGVLGALVTDLPAAAVLTAVALLALAVGWITGSSLAQETTTNHPLPRARAAWYGVGAGFAVAGAGLAGATAALPLAAGWYAPAGLLLVGGVCLLSALGATQTNRKKAWARDAERVSTAEDRFSQDPAAAARFGIYTVVIWTAAAGVFLAVGFAGGWAWSWLVFLPATAVWMFVLARMQFGADRGHS